MDDLISRQAAIETALRAISDLQGKDSNRDEYIISEMEEIPSAERHGMWIVEHGVFAGDGIYGDMGEYSVCGLHLRNYEWDYCPMCGASMRGKE